MSDDFDPLQHSNKVIQTALDHSDYDSVYALVSGGHDSLTAMHVAYAHPDIDLDGIVHINTGIGIPKTRDFVKERADALDLEFIEVTSDVNTDDGKSMFGELVTKFGFPGPPVHRWMYVNLKEKPLSKWLTTAKKEKTDDGKLGLISGVRRSESTRRMETISAEGIQEKLGAIWISPIADWNALEVREYRRAYDLPMNPVVDALEMSGECLCGSFGDRDELRMIELFYPETYERLVELEAAVVSWVQAGKISPDYALWGHGKMDDRELEARMNDEQMTLCSGCEQRGECSVEMERDTDPVTPVEADSKVKPVPEAAAVENALIADLAESLFDEAQREEFEEPLLEAEYIVEAYESGRLMKSPEAVFEEIWSGDLHEDEEVETPEELHSILEFTS